MKKLLFTPVITVAYNNDTNVMVDAIEEINDELIRRGYSANQISVASPRSSSAPKTSQGPLEKRWCELKQVRGVRRTEGRTAEEQAEYNLRNYADYNDEQIDELKESVPSQDISEQSGVVHEDSENDDEVKESDLL